VGGVSVEYIPSFEDFSPLSLPENLNLPHLANIEWIRKHECVVVPLCM